MSKTSAEYIKMVLAIDKDFFDKWQWKAGDRAILMDDRYKREVMVLNTEQQISVENLKQATLLYPYSLHADKETEWFENLRHIPSQEQLQDIIMEKMNWSPKALLEMFMFWAQTGIQRDDFWQFDSWDEGWLQFFMFVIDGKSWNGDLWV